MLTYTKNNHTTGRVVFFTEQFRFEEAKQDGVLYFFCGPEDVGGYLYDHDDLGLYPQLEELFKDIPGFEVGAAEQFHGFPIASFTTPQLAWDFVKGRLIAADAVEIMLESEEYSDNNN